MAQQITDNYIIDILQILKNLAFHEIFMQKLRQQLADNEKFDPFTAFKMIDSFKHNMIINVELKSFLQMQGYDVVISQAQQCIKALNKSQDSLDYDRFLQMVMPYNLKKKNLSLTRFNKMQVDIGTYSFVSQIKNTSRQLIGNFFVKEIQFYRNFSSQRQYFCQKWGGDIYTISQSLFKSNDTKLNTSLKNPLFQYESSYFNQIQTSQINKKNQVNFDNFYELGRKYKCYFNKQEFKSIWRRIKRIQEKIILKPEQIFLKQDDLIDFLLVKNFNTKLKYANKYDIPLKNMKMPPPSYKLPVPQEMIHNPIKYNQQQQKKYYERKIEEIKKQVNDPFSYRLKNYCSYPELQMNTVSPMLRQKQQQWKSVFNKMSVQMIDERYREIIQNDKFKPPQWRG